ncbi:MAG: HAMP domain-containing histidine kinase, partial [Cytophagales bacterium]|nr:HAMP domain-containing histidine kinase [Armatimonadota bacterium]
EAAALLLGSAAVPEGVPTYNSRVLDPAGRNYLTRGREAPWDGGGYRRALRGETDHRSGIAPSGDRIRICSVPVLGANGVVEAVVQTARSLQPVEATLMATDRTLLAFLPLALLAATAVGTLLTHRALAPVGELSRAAARIGAADLGKRLPVAGADEFARLAQVFNAMLARLETAFEQQRRFTADASHELRSPLTVVLGQASLALASPQNHEGRRAWERTARAARSMERLVRDLLLLARSDARQLEMERIPLSARELLEAAVEAIPPADREPGAPITLLCPEGLWLTGDSAHLERAIHNLLSNALRHTPPSGSITLSAARRETEGVTVTVTDTGSGIPPEDLPHILERFYRADRGRARVAGGTGLGLAIAQSIAEAHGGSLQIESRVGEGVTARIELPQPVPISADSTVSASLDHVPEHLL